MTRTENFLRFSPEVPPAVFRQTGRPHEDSNAYGCTSSRHRYWIYREVMMSVES